MSLTNFFSRIVEWILENLKPERPQKSKLFFDSKYLLFNDFNLEIKVKFSMSSKMVREGIPPSDWYLKIKNS